MTSTFTPLPLWVAVAILEIRRRLCKPKNSESDPEKVKDTDDMKNAKEMDTIEPGEDAKMLKQ